MQDKIDVYQYDNDGFFVVNFTIDANDDIPSNCTVIECPNGLYRPKFDGTSWIEGASQSYIDNLTHDSILMSLRKNRQIEFSKYDKYQYTLVWAELTQQQKDDYIIWRNQWLDVTNTLVEPTPLDWFD